MDATVVCIDQTKKSVQVEPRAAWFPRGTRPAVALSGQRDWTCLLGAITEDGDRFFGRVAKRSRVCLWCSQLRAHSSLLFWWIGGAVRRGTTGSTLDRRTSPAEVGA